MSVASLEIIALFASLQMPMFLTGSNFTESFGPSLRCVYLAHPSDVYVLTLYAGVKDVYTAYSTEAYMNFIFTM